MKYLAVLLACLLILGIGASAIWLFMEASDCKWTIILCISDLLGFIYLLDNIENIADNMLKFWYKMVKDSKQE